MVGVTRYCDYPEAAKNILPVGGYNDVNEERLLSLKPDLVLLLRTHTNIIAFCRKHHLKYEAFNSESIEGIHDMVKRIGDLVGQRKRSREWFANHPFPLTPSTLPAQSVLVILEQVVRNDRIEAAYVLGKEAFYSPMLEASGFRSLFKGSQRYPMMGREGLFNVRPDKVIVLEVGQARWYKGVWPTSTKIVFLSKTVMKRPGPRYDQILSALMKAQH